MVDVFVLFILHSIPGRKKSVEALFSNKIRQFLFTEDLMANVFGSHAGVQLLPPCSPSSFSLIPLFPPSLPFLSAQALREFFPSILSLCETLLCSSSPTITTFTTSLYQHLFSAFDVYCRQVGLSVCLSVRLSIPLLMVYCFLWLGGDWCSHHSRGQWDALRD